MTKWILGVLASVVLGTGALAGAAFADDAGFGGGIPLQTSDAAHLPMIESLEPVAEAYWQSRGISLPTPVEVFVIPDNPVGSAFGREFGTQVWLTEWLLAQSRGIAGRSTLCEFYLHERGHNAGLTHNSGDPVMEAYPDETLNHVIPKCFKWAERGFRKAISP